MEVAPIFNGEIDVSTLREVYAENDVGRGSLG